MAHPIRCPKAYHEGAVVPAAEYAARHPELYRWCHADLVNSDFQYRYGLNVHPHERRFREPEVHLDVLLWGMPAEDIYRFPGHGTTLCRVELPPDALVYVPADGTCFKASRMILRPACAVCVATRIARENPHWQLVAPEAVLGAMELTGVACTCVPGTL